MEQGQKSKESLKTVMADHGNAGHREPKAGGKTPVIFRTSLDLPRNSLERP